MADNAPTRPFTLLIPLALFAAFLALYALTAAPSVLSGDSAEFQLAAVLLGVPHPTTYPLYTVLGHLVVRLLPVGEPAWRVTLLSALCAALTVALFYALARRVLGAAGPALLSALALGLSAGLWNAATLAEVYALLALLSVALALALAWDYGPPATGQRPSTRSLLLAACIGGLGFTHHGLFAITVLPLLAVAVLAPLIPRPGQTEERPSAFSLYKTLSLVLCFSVGLLPWLYPLVQFARHGPFDGLDYGLPQHYFWGAPRTYGEVLDLMSGGTIRRGIFRPPEPAAALETLRMIGRRLLFEFGPLGAALGVLGAWAHARAARRTFRAAAWVFFATLAYLLLLGPAVGDAPVFTLPMLLPWALWIGAGAAAILSRVDARPGTHHQGGIVSSGRLRTTSRLVVRRWSLVLVALLALTLAWGVTRYRVSAKQHLWLYREFAAATLGELPPGAVVLAHWEQGMALQYLRLVEGVRPDVWVDVVEPSDEAWGPRAERRYQGRPVFFVGPASSVAGLPVELVREDEYADLFRLRRSCSRGGAGAGQAHPCAPFQGL